MIRKLSLILTIIAALGIVVVMAGCGKKGKLKLPPEAAQQIDVPPSNYV